jgi:hypothetical protein
MALIVDNSSPSLSDRARCGVEAETIEPHPVSTVVHGPDIDPLPGTRFLLPSDDLDYRCGVGARALRGIAFAIVLSVPLWAAIALVTMSIIGFIFHN